MKTDSQNIYFRESLLVYSVIKIWRIHKRCYITSFSMTSGNIIPDIDREIYSFELYDESYRGMYDPESIFYLLIPIK